MITDSNQARMAKMAVCPFQEEVIEEATPIRELFGKTEKRGYLAKSRAYQKVAVWIRYLPT